MSEDNFNKISVVSRTTRGLSLSEDLGIYRLFKDFSRKEISENYKISSYYLRAAIYPDFNIKKNEVLLELDVIYALWMKVVAGKDWRPAYRIAVGVDILIDLTDIVESQRIEMAKFVCARTALKYAMDRLENVMKESYCSTLKEIDDKNWIIPHTAFEGEWKECRGHDVGCNYGRNIRSLLKQVRVDFIPE